MGGIDTTPLRQLYARVELEPEYAISSFAAYQPQPRDPQEKLPEPGTSSIDRLRDLAVEGRNSLQIGALEFAVALDLLHGGLCAEAASHFEVARRQWASIDHLPLVSLAYLGAGEAYHAEGNFRRAAAAYLKVKECVSQADTEPRLLEMIEAGRSLQSFWNELERRLEQEILTLRRDLGGDDGDALNAKLDDSPGEPDTGSSDGPRQQAGFAKLKLQMQTAGTLTADDAVTLIFKTVDGLETLNTVLSSASDEQGRPLPPTSAIKYAGQGGITIEMANVTDRTVAFCRWLMTIVEAEHYSGRDVRESRGESSTWSRWQVQPGYIGEFVKSFVLSATGNSPDESVVQQLTQIIDHLAELRLNCNLTVK